MGEDQHTAGVRCLDEPQRGNRLAGAGRMLKPEALGGVGVLGLLDELLLLFLILVLPVLRLLVFVLVLLGLGTSSSSSSSSRSRARSSVGPSSPFSPSSPASSASIGGSATTCSATTPAPLPPPLPLRWTSASSAVSVPDSASTWWADRTCRRRGAAPPRTAGARVRAAARTPAAIRSTAACGRRRPRPARRRARAGEPTLGPAPPRASRPRRRNARGSASLRAQSRQDSERGWSHPSVYGTVRTDKRAAA